MIGKLLPIILLLVGAGAGIGAGLALRPAPEPVEAAKEGEDAAEKKDGKEEKAGDAKDKGGKDKDDKSDGPPEGREYVKLSNQFVVPVVKQDVVRSMVVMSLSIEVVEGSKDVVFSREPKLRNSFLEVLFDHANVGGFDGAFTDVQNLNTLRTALREIAQRDLGEDIIDVLILEIARQDY